MYLARVRGVRRVGALPTRRRLRSWRVFPRFEPLRGCLLRRVRRARRAVRARGSRVRPDPRALALVAPDPTPSPARPILTREPLVPRVRVPHPQPRAPSRTRPPPSRRRPRRARTDHPPARRSRMAPQARPHDAPPPRPRLHRRHRRLHRLRPTGHPRTRGGPTPCLLPHPLLPPRPSRPVADSRATGSAAAWRLSVSTNHREIRRPGGRRRGVRSDARGVDTLVDDVGYPRDADLVASARGDGRGQGGARRLGTLPTWTPCARCVVCARPRPGEDEGFEVRSGSNPRAEDAATSASAALESQHCSATASDGDGTRHAVVYQRDVGRSLEDVEGAASSLERALGADWRVSVVTHHERLPRRLRGVASVAPRRWSPRTGSSPCSTCSCHPKRCSTRCSRTGTTSTGTNARRSSEACRTGR